MEPIYLTTCAVLKLAYGLMKLHQHGADILNKTCSFEVSIGLLPLILIISSKESLL